MRGGALHNGTFFGVGARSVREGLVGLSSAKWTAPGLGLGGVWISCAHLTYEILKAGVNVPVPLGRGFVEGNPPSDSVTTDQLLGHFTLCCQVEFGPHDHDWC